MGSHRLRPHSCLLLHLAQDVVFFRRPLRPSTRSFKRTPCSFPRRGRRARWSTSRGSTSWRTPVCTGMLTFFREILTPKAPRCTNRKLTLPALESPTVDLRAEPSSKVRAHQFKGWAICALEAAILTRAISRLYGLAAINPASTPRIIFIDPRSLDQKLAPNISKNLPMLGENSVASSTSTNKASTALQKTNAVLP